MPCTPLPNDAHRPSSRTRRDISRPFTAAAVVATLVLTALLTSAAAQAKPNPAAPPIDAAAVYQRTCALCHGADRAGYAADHAPSLRSPELWATAPPAWMWQAIAFGRPGTPMAAFAADQGGPLDHDTQHALIDWLAAQAGATLGPQPEVTVRGDPTRGQAVYAEHCVSCHGSKGEGITTPALGNPVLLATSPDGFLREAVRRGRSGTPMPAFTDTLSAQQIDDVVVFLRSRAAGWTAPAPVVVRPPPPSQAVRNPTAPPAALQPRDDRFVSAEAVGRALAEGKRLVLLDARPLSDWQRGHLPGALPVPFYDGVDAILPHLPRDGTPVVAYCACPHAASGQVVDALRKAGVNAAYILDEGVLVWAARGLPMAIGGDGG